MTVYVNTITTQKFCVDSRSFVNVGQNVQFQLYKRLSVIWSRFNFAGFIFHNQNFLRCDYIFKYLVFFNLTRLVTSFFSLFFLHIFQDCGNQGDLAPINLEVKLKQPQKRKALNSQTLRTFAVAPLSPFSTQVHSPWITLIISSINIILV